MAPPQQVSAWSECMQHVKFWRSEIKRSFGEPLNQVELVEDSEGKVTIYGLANTSEDNGSPQQTILAALLSKDELRAFDEKAASASTSTTSADQISMIALKSLFNLADFAAVNGNGTAEKPSAELCLFYERLRGQIVNGISSYSFHPPSGSFLVSSASQLHVFQSNKLSPVASYLKSAPINATFSPISSEYVAFCSKGQLFVDKQNEKIFESDAHPQITNGMAAFIAQEEFERFEGFWWSPTRVEVLYERVDESNVVELSFVTPGKQADAESKMRYPLAGTANTTSTLHICHINVENNDMVLDMELRVDLKKVVPWYEYLVRCGWTLDGEHVYMYVMNRVQTRAALLLVPRVVFCHELVDNGEDLVKVLYEEESNYWVNPNNLIHFLPSEPDGRIRVIIGSEKHGFCHLYLHIFELSYDEPLKLEEMDEDVDATLDNTPGITIARRSTAMLDSGGGRTNGLLTDIPGVDHQPPPSVIVNSSLMLPTVDETAPLTDVVTSTAPGNVPLSVPSQVAAVIEQRRPSLTARRLSCQTGQLGDHREIPLTDVDGGWAVVREAVPTVDHRRQLIYYLANCVSPKLISLCVSSYAIPSRECRLLTPENLCYKFERSQPSLNLNPNVGFVCWLSSVHQLPECRFYCLVHSGGIYRNSSSASLHSAASESGSGFPGIGGGGFSSSELPTAVFAYRIALQPSPTIGIVGLPTLPASQQSSAMKQSALTQKSVLSANTDTNTNTAPMGAGATFGKPCLYRRPDALFRHRFFEYRSANSGRVHHALLLWPLDGDEAEESNANCRSKPPYPVIQNVYAGPTVQLVRDSWHSVAQYLKYVAMGFSVLVVDGRGSANRGIEFEGCIKHALGSVEVDDQVEGLRMVAAQTGGSLLDLGRVGVIGWSYGGYMSTLLIAKHPEMYRASCVGGAVTDWALYDTAYTERYMGLPQEQVDAYRNSASLTHLDELPDEEGRLLVVHGMLDENVHFHHTDKLINGLVAAAKPHQLLLLPGERHSVRNGDTIEYLHATVLTFFRRALMA